MCAGVLPLSFLDQLPHHEQYLPEDGLHLQLGGVLGVLREHKLVTEFSAKQRRQGALLWY